MSAIPPVLDPQDLVTSAPATPGRGRLHRLVFGNPRDLNDRSIFHRMALIPFLAWVGLGADGLSSSSYGPEEAFRTLGEHTYLAVVLAGMVVITIVVIATAYSQIIEEFPHGGGGYVVASKLLGARAGVVSGSSLLVDYVLTITVSISAAGDALFSFLPLHLHGWKLAVEIICILALTTLNMRGVKESVIALMPIFVAFLVTHVILIGGAFASHLSALPAVSREIAGGVSSGYARLGITGMLLLLVHAYSLGGGTYTGIEAVSNGLTIMREPRVRSGKRTMLYMGVSLSVTASGLLLCYLLYAVRPVEGRTLNAVLADRFTHDIPGGWLLALVTILSEGALLIVAAQAGFIDGPRILANMALDAWVPRRFASLSDRLTTRNGILLMGAAALLALLYTRGDVRHLVIMYSINVFLTFSLSMFAMLRLSHTRRRTSTRAGRLRLLFGAGFVLCATILVVTVTEKFSAGGWMTLLITGLCVVSCLLIRRHYDGVAERFRTVDGELKRLEAMLERMPSGSGIRPGADATAVILTSGYSAVGIHTILHLHRAFTGHFRRLVFVSVGVLDSGAFKGRGEIEALENSTRRGLEQYRDIARTMGFESEIRLATGIDVVTEAERLCVEVASAFPRCVFFSAQVVFRHERWYHRPLHNQTSFAIQRRLHGRGLTMVILPIRVE